MMMVKKKSNNRKLKNYTTKQAACVTAQAALKQYMTPPRDSKTLSASSLEVVVIGSGPVAQNFVTEFSKINPNTKITHYGKRPRMPYKHTLLYSFLQGTTTIADVMEPASFHAGNVVHRCDISILAIDSEENTLLDSAGNVVQYDKLVFATGAHVDKDGLPGNSLAGVFALNSLEDVLRLHSRKARTSHTVVIGADELEIEAAKGMLSSRTRVTVINPNSHIMTKQISRNAATCVQNSLELDGLRFKSNAKVVKILGNKIVTGVKLDNGHVILCDTVIMAAYLKPCVELAKTARIKVDKGVLVNDYMQTSNPDIYAIGKCAQYRDETTAYFDLFIGQATVASWHMGNQEILGVT